MTTAQQPIDTQANLTDLQEETFAFITFMAGTICLIWFVLAVLSQFFRPYPLSFWLGLAILTLCVIVGSLLRDKHLERASLIVVGGILITITCILWSFPSPVTACLFVIPIIFASALLGEKELFWVAAASSMLTLAIGILFLREGLPAGTEAFLAAGVALSRDLLASSFLVPIGIIVLTAIASWGTSRRWYTALAWIWHSYERARSNEQVARQNQAELKRVLKSLDNALYGLERANFELMRARNQAEEARRIKQQFAQNISHELRTPLNLIVGFTEMMAETPDYYGVDLTPEYLRDLSTVYRNARHLQTLVNDVLDLARIEAAQMNILPEETDPGRLVQDALNTISSLVTARGLALHTDVEQDLPHVWVDPTRIRQVLFNLLNNAIRFTERGSITVRVYHQDEAVVYSVADTGMGIKAGEFEHIFEEFHQADGSRRRRHEGAGLGLTISKRFVELHRGRIWAESAGEAGEGSTFYFSLPTDRVALVETPSPYSEHTLLADLNPIKASQEPILLAVTRSLSAATLLTHYVQGCRTVIVSDLEEAGHSVQQLMPQAVVVDRNCVDLDEGDMERTAQKWGAPRMPFIICSLPDEAPLQQRLSVEGYLVKPISRRTVWDVMHRFGERLEHVLVVDGDRDFARLLNRILDENPIRRYRVTRTHSGEQALARMKQQVPDLLFLDLALPGIDGLQVLDQVRSNPLWQHISVIIVSAQGETDSFEILQGAVSISKAEGMRPGEVVAWVQHVVNSAIKTLPTPSAPNATSASKPVSLETRWRPARVPDSSP